MRPAVLLLALSLLPGCLRYADIRPETRPVAPDAVLGAPVEAKSCMFSLFYGIPFGEHPLITARDAALEESHGDALVDVTIAEDYIFCVVGGLTCVTVRGRPARAPVARSSGATPVAPIPPPTSEPPKPLPVTITEGDQEKAAAGPQLVRFDESIPGVEPIPVLGTWIGDDVAVTFRSGRVAKGRLVAVSRESLTVLPSGGHKAWTAPVSVMSEVVRDAPVAPTGALPEPPEPPPERPQEQLPSDVDLTAIGSEAAEASLTRLIDHVVRVDRRVGLPVVGTLVQVNRSRLLVKTGEGMVQIGNATRVRFPAE